MKDRGANPRQVWFQCLAGLSLGSQDTGHQGKNESICCIFSITECVFLSEKIQKFIRQCFNCHTSHSSLIRHKG